MKFCFFKETFHQDIYQEMINSQNQSLMETLVAMQLDRGVSPETADATANATVLAVSSVESVRREVSNDLPAVLDRLFADVDQCSDPILRLYQLYFGLTAYEDETLVARIHSGVPEEDLFWEYYILNKDQMTAEELKAGIRDAMALYDLPEPVLRAVAKKIHSSADYFATAAALGEGGYNLKCITAMELYLKADGALSIQDAANAACASVEAQAAADAVSKGFLTREAAKKILIIAGITLAVVGLGAAIYYYGSYAALTQAAQQVAQQVVTVEMPAVFAEFATATTATGAPAYTFNQAWIYKPLAEAAKTKGLTGLLTLLSGIGLTGLAPKLSQFLGKLRIAFEENGSSIAQGLDSLADHVLETRKTVPVHLQKARKMQKQTQEALAES